MKKATRFILYLGALLMGGLFTAVIRLFPTKKQNQTRSLLSPPTFFPEMNPGYRLTPAAKAPLRLMTA